MNWPVKFAAKEKIEKINHSLPSFNIQSVIIISLSSFSFSSIFRNAKFISAKFPILADSRKLIPKISRFFQIAKVSFPAKVPSLKVRDTLYSPRTCTVRSLNKPCQCITMYGWFSFSYRVSQKNFATFRNTPKFDYKANLWIYYLASRSITKLFSQL